LFPSEAELDSIIASPDSVAWRITSDVRLYFVMLYPLLLQVAHPTVGAGVRDYSDFDERPWERLLRTLDYVCLLVYGGRDAVAAGQRLRELHKRFRGVREDGRRYHALEPDAYAWVHATLLETYVAGHRHFGRALSRAEIEQFYEEYLRLGRLIGVRPGDLPAGWDGFREYFEGMVEHELVRTGSIERVLATVRAAMHPPVRFPDLLWRAVRIPARRAMWLGGIGLMDRTLRARLGIPWSAADEAQFRALGRSSRALTPVLPMSLTVMGPAQLRWRRRAIERGPLGSKSLAC
jgi:uncharacterized protein (DUF2236 family)